VFEGVECVLLAIAPSPGGVLLGEIVQWFGEFGETPDERAVKVTEAQK
jgi:hypothetical protein